MIEVANRISEMKEKSQPKAGKSAELPPLPPAKGQDAKVKRAPPPVPPPSKSNVPEEQSQSTLFFSSLHLRSAPAGVLDQVPAVIRPSSKLSEREYMEIEVIKLLLKSYFSITQRTMCDMLPKVIMLKLVNSARNDLQKALLEELYKPESVDLLNEAGDVAESRKKLKKLVKGLSTADLVIRKVQ